MKGLTYKVDRRLVTVANPATGRRVECWQGNMSFWHVNGILQNKQHASRRDMLGHAEEFLKLAA